MMEQATEQKLIKRMAYRFSQRNPYIDYEDILSEAYVAYLQMKKRYRKKRGASKDTLAWLALHRHLIWFCQRQAKMPETRDDSFFIHMESLFPSAEEIASFREMLTNNLSQEAKQVCKLIFDTPTEFFPLTNLEEILEEGGWGWVKIKTSFREIRRLLRTRAQLI
jgi:hypothetical protein